MKKEVQFGIIALYLLITMGLFFMFALRQPLPHPLLFFKDYSIAEKMRDAFAADQNANQLSLFFTRVFYNKVYFAADTFILFIYQALDPTILFSLSKISLYGSTIPVPFLYIWELPLFLFSLAICIRNWTRIQKFHKLLYFLITVSLLTVGLIYPAYYPYKFLPLILTIRIIISIGLLEFLKAQK